MVRLLIYIVLMTSIRTMTGYKKIPLYVFPSTAIDHIAIPKHSALWDSRYRIKRNSTNHKAQLRMQPDRTIPQCIILLELRYGLWRPHFNNSTNLNQIVHMTQLSACFPLIVIISVEQNNINCKYRDPCCVKKCHE